MLLNLYPTQQLPNTLIIIYPHSPQYNESRGCFNTRINTYPAAICYCYSEEDIRLALGLANKSKKSVRIRSGGHSYEGYSSDNDVYVIDISGMKKISLSYNKKTVTVQAGCTVGEIYKNLWESKLTIPAGSYPDVGIAGLALSVGNSFSTRMMGLTCDAIQEIKLMNHEGKVLNASVTHNPDLFWACRGAGGGMFGVVLAIKIKTFAADKNVSIFRIEWPWESRVKVSDCWFEILKTAPKELMMFLRFSKKNGKKTVAGFGQFWGALPELKNWIAQLLTITPLEPPILNEMNCMQAIEYWAGIDRTKKHFKASSCYLTASLSSASLKVIDKFFSQEEIDNAFTVFDSYGGAVSDLHQDFDAFAYRKTVASVQTLVYFEPENQKQALQWSAAYYEEFKQASHSIGAGKNYEFSEADAKRYFGDHLPRLIEIKEEYDPQNVFTHPQFPHMRQEDRSLEPLARARL